jgi:hypothetical protein
MRDPDFAREPLLARSQGLAGEVGIASPCLPAAFSSSATRPVERTRCSAARPGAPFITATPAES